MTRILSAVVISCRFGQLFRVHLSLSKFKVAGYGCVPITPLVKSRQNCIAVVASICPGGCIKCNNRSKFGSDIFPAVYILSRDITHIKYYNGSLNIHTSVGCRTLYNAIMRYIYMPRSTDVAVITLLAPTSRGARHLFDSHVSDSRLSDVAIIMQFAPTTATSSGQLALIVASPYEFN